MTSGIGSSDGSRTFVVLFVVEWIASAAVVAMCCVDTKANVQ